MSFFDTTPTGRIVNRFTEDMNVVDDPLVGTAQIYLYFASEILATLVVISFTTPPFALCMIPVLVFYMKQQSFFTQTYRELTRISTASMSPLIALLGEFLDGLSTIRAYNAEPVLKRRLLGLVDKQLNAAFLLLTSTGWLEIRLQLVCAFISFCACLFSVLAHGTQ